MNPLIFAKETELTDLCRRLGVRRLELFGSGTGEAFDPDQSDLDFLVEFFSAPAAEHADRYLTLLQSLQDLFDRRVDLVEVRAIKNPHFRRAIEASRTVLYAA